MPEFTFYGGPIATKWTMRANTTLAHWLQMPIERTDTVIGALEPSYALYEYVGGGIYLYVRSSDEED